MPWSKNATAAYKLEYSRRWEAKKRAAKWKDDGDMRTCRRCGNKLLRNKDNFYENKQSRLGFKAQCIPCVRAMIVRGPYKTRQGLHREIRAEYLEAQKYCAICHDTKNLYLDHCHKTGKIRAVLCNCCNSALGKFRDNPGLMRRAAAYIEYFAPP